MPNPSPSHALRCLIGLLCLHAGSPFLVAAGAAEVDVVLLGGQSNMQGIAKIADLSPDTPRTPADTFFWNGKAFEPLVVGTTRTSTRAGEFGPELGLAAGLPKTGRRRYLVKYAASGMPLHHGWDAAAWVGDPPGPRRRSFYPGDRADDPNQGTLYREMLGRFRAALDTIEKQGDKPVIRGFAWMQGEADAKHDRSATDYAASLRRLRDRLATDLGTKRLPLVFGQVLPHEPAMARFTHRREIRAAMAAADERSGRPEAIPHARMVSTDGFGLLPDTVHYDAAGQLALGRAFAAELATHDLPKPATPSPGLRYYYPVPKAAQPQTHEFDVVIYGASPAAVSAAVQARTMGKTAGVFVFRRHVGGMSSSGLSDVDYGKKEAIGGMAKRVFLDFFKKQVQSPAEVEQLFLTMLTDLDIPVFFEHRLHAVERNGDRITGLMFENGVAARGKIFCDTTYEGDLVARAGVEHVAGREANTDHGETLNGIQIGARHSPHNFQWRVDPYREPGNPASGVIEGVDAESWTQADHGKADKRYQPFCFRVFATRHDPMPWPKPAEYRVERYELLKRYVNAAPDSEWWNLIYSRGPLKLNEGDCNAAGPVSLDYVGGSLRWVEASYEEREQIFQEHVNYQKGFLYFLANDPGIPAELRNRVSQFGLPKKEFPETDGWPHELYVREGRRLRGDYVLTEQDCLGKTSIEDSIGLGSFIMDSHVVRRIIYKTAKDAHITHLRTSSPDEITETQRSWQGDMVGVEGQFDRAVPAPYRISYRCICPRRADCVNLLVPTVISSTHPAFGSSRMEPVFMILGQSAGAAAALAIDGNIPVQDVDYARLREILIKEGQLLD